MKTLTALSDAQLESFITRLERKKAQTDNWNYALRCGWMRDLAAIEQMKRHAPACMVGGYAWEKANGYR